MPVSPRFLAPLALTLALAPAAPAQRSSPAAPLPANPVIADDFPDPFILRVGGTYYAYATNAGGVTVPVRRSTDLADWTAVGDALPALPGWATGGYTWAPEVMPVSNGYALYYTARHTESGRQCIGVATAKTPQGPFVDKSEAPLVCQLDLGGSIDPSPLRDADGQRYLYWKNDGNCCGQYTAIWAQKLSADGTQLVGKPTDLVYNTALWEGNLIEAPNVYRRALPGGGAKYYLFYSAADYASDTYGVGYAVGTSPLGPFRKQTKDLAWLFSKGKVAGPGGQGIVTDAAGNTWFSYHAWTAGQVGYDAGGQRSMRIGRLSFDAAGRPVLRER